jgi:hypothetical protein
MSKHRAEEDGSEAAAPASPATDRPILRVVRGNPSAEELAVLTAVISAASGGDEPTSVTPPVRGRWNDPAHMHRRAWSAGPGGWRAAR